MNETEVKCIKIPMRKTIVVRILAAKRKNEFLLNFIN